MFAALTSLLLCSSIGESAQDSVAFQVLATTRGFGLGGIGLDGVIPRESYAFAEILRARNPDELFQRLLEEGTIGGQMYALAGLYLTNRGAFERARTRYAEDHRRIRLKEGCLESSPTAADFASRIAEGSIPESMAKMRLPARPLGGMLEPPL